MSKTFNLSDALISLYPDNNWNCKYTQNTFDWHDDTPAPTMAELEAEVVRLQAAYDAKEYARSRAGEYPSIGDQLDALFHAGVFPEEMAAQIQAVKDKYPKG
jgi:hypothetical protein